MKVTAQEISVIDIVDRAILNQNTMSLKVMKDQGAVVIFLVG